MNPISTLPAANSATELALLRQLLADSPHPVVRLDAAGRPRYGNAAALVLGRSLRRAEWLGACRQLRTLAGGQWPTRPNPARVAVGGRAFELRAVADATGSGETTIYLTDLPSPTSEQKPAHGPDAPAQPREPSRDLLTYSEDSEALICTHDLAGTLLSLNPAATVFLQAGAPPNSTAASALLGGALAALAPPEARAGVADYLRRIAETGRQRGVVAVRLGQDTRYLLYHNHLVRETGQPPYVVGYGQDITERVRLEQAQQRVRTEAEVAVRAREQFLTNVSHEIRTPLNGVLGLAAQLAKTPLDARQQAYVRSLRQAGQHLLRVVGDVLDLAKLTAGKLPLEEAPFNLCASLAAALRPLVAQAQAKGVRLAGTPLRASCAHPWVVGDAHRLNQIFINLVANAIKFTPPGGRIIVVAEQLAETATTLTVRLSVEDTGVGIALDKQEVIFESFRQADATTARLFGGTGLGLSISRGLTEQLGGQLRVRSELGRGSTFSFELTLPKSAVPPPAAAAATYDTGALRGRRVLLVEDNELNRLVARLLLDEWGAAVEEADSGPAALALVRANPPYDLVLMDIQLPGLNGLDTTAAIRALPDAARAGQPIVALTASTLLADAAHFAHVGFDASLSKPLDEALLFQTLADLLRPAQPVQPVQPAQPAQTGRAKRTGLKPATAAPPRPAAARGRAGAKKATAQPGQVVAETDATETAPAPTTSSTPVPAYDLTRLRELAQGRPAFVGKIVRSFLRNIPGSLARLSAAAGAGRWAEVAKLTHHIRPSLESVGVPDVAKAARLLEAATPGHYAQLPAAAAHLVGQARKALMELAVKW